LLAVSPRFKVAAAAAMVLVSGETGFLPFVGFSSGIAGNC
jgi:hypothetical protein